MREILSRPDAPGTARSSKTTSLIPGSCSSAAERHAALATSNDCPSILRSKLSSVRASLPRSSTRRTRVDRGTSNGTSSAHRRAILGEQSGDALRLLPGAFASSDSPFRLMSPPPRLLAVKRSDTQILAHGSAMLNRRHVLRRFVQEGVNGVLVKGFALTSVRDRGAARPVRKACRVQSGKPGRASKRRNQFAFVTNSRFARIMWPQVSLRAEIFFTLAMLIGGASSGGQPLPAPEPPRARGEVEK